jgi:hypothetical protein
MCCRYLQLFCRQCGYSTEHRGLAPAIICTNNSKLQATVGKVH